MQLLAKFKKILDMGFHIFHFLLQILLDFLMYVGILRTLIIVFAIIAVFEYLFWRVPLFNPGNLNGVGVAGIVGDIGYVLQLCNLTTGVSIFLLEGFIGSGLYRGKLGGRKRANEERAFAAHDRLSRAIEKRNE